MSRFTVAPFYFRRFIFSFRPKYSFLNIIINCRPNIVTYLHTHTWTHVAVLFTYLHNSQVSIIATATVYTINHCTYSCLVIIDHSVDCLEGDFYIINFPVARRLLCALCSCQLLLLRRLSSNTATVCGLQGNHYAPWGVLCVMSTKPTFTVHYLPPTHYERHVFCNLVSCDTALTR